MLAHVPLAECRSVLATPHRTYNRHQRTAPRARYAAAALSDSDAYADCNCDADADGYAASHRDADSDGYASPHGNAYGNSDASSNANASYSAR